MKRFTLSPEARQDIREIRRYYLKVADVCVARHVLEAIERACELSPGDPAPGTREPISPTYP